MRTGVMSKLDELAKTNKSVERRIDLLRLAMA